MENLHINSEELIILKYLKNEEKKTHKDDGDDILDGLYFC